MDTNGDNPSNNPIPIHNEINMTMKQCKPCITIREIIKILWSNIRLFYTNCRRDIRSYSKINQTVCLLDHIKPMSTYEEYELIKKIREQATENYDPIRQEIVEKYIKSVSSQRD